ncbi:hypothetical protein F8M41_023227 [Gigaspora margarita]|uniref:Uncharacterized protein n=1 Tax=Gigaspora margarita TaxID=4874 RepID=A0A8H4ADQ2_GIGMA|nr:hypothetical protein F8M41_023227 [Gigaspora margarita]
MSTRRVPLHEKNTTNKLSANNEIIEENDSEITRLPLSKKQKSQDKRPLGENITKKSTSSYTNMINCDNSDQEYQESIHDSSNLALDTDNDNITEPRLTSSLPIADERLSNDKEFEKLDSK